MHNALMENYAELLGARLREARVAKGFDPHYAAGRMKIAYATLMQHERGIRNAKRHIADYARLYGVNFIWLANGSGPMHGPDQLVADIQALKPSDRGVVEAMVIALKTRKDEQSTD